MCFCSYLTNCLILSLLFNRYARSRLLHSIHSMPSGFHNVEGKHCGLPFVLSYVDFLVSCLNQCICVLITTDILTTRPTTL